ITSRISGKKPFDVVTYFPANSQRRVLQRLYFLLENLVEEVDLCSGDLIMCAETQLKMMIQMRVRDQDLVQHLISLDAAASLHTFVTYCRSFEVAYASASAIYTFTSQLHDFFAYKKEQQWQRMADFLQLPQTQSLSIYSCQSSNHRHGPRRCPAANSTCTNCGCKSHWARTRRCPA
ncbi:hypothetical protein SK128_010831, partial [Halocaridina rubra]